MIVFHCPFCNNQLPIKDKFAGRWRKCRFCGKVSLVPPLPHDPSHPVIVAHQAARKAAHRRMVFGTMGGVMTGAVYGLAAGAGDLLAGLSVVAGAVGGAAGGLLVEAIKRAILSPPGGAVATLVGGTVSGALVGLLHGFLTGSFREAVILTAISGASGGAFALVVAGRLSHPTGTPR